MVVMISDILGADGVTIISSGLMISTIISRKYVWSVETQGPGTKIYEYPSLKTPINGKGIPTWEVKFRETEPPAEDMALV